MIKIPDDKLEILKELYKGIIGARTRRSRRDEKELIHIKTEYIIALKKRYNLSDEEIMEQYNEYLNKD